MTLASVQVTRMELASLWRSAKTRGEPMVDHVPLDMESVVYVSSMMNDGRG